MTQQNKLTSDELCILRADMEKIKTICVPHSDIFKPDLKITDKKDFKDWYGIKHSSGYEITPDALKTLWESKKYLEERGISYFKTQKHKWFYNTHTLTNELYADDGSQKIAFSFPFWVDGENNWKIPEFKNFVQTALNLHDEKGTLNQEDINTLWTDDLSKQVFKKSPESNSIGKVVMDMIEDLRPILVKHLTDEQYIPISKTRSFKIFSTQNPLKQPMSLQEQVKRYLKKKKNAIYLLSEKYGYIQNASTLLHYQKLRDSVRHPEEVHVRSKAPEQIYEDLKKTLPQINTEKNNENEDYQTDFSTVQTIRDLDELMKILDIYADKEAKRGTKQYWDSLEKDGILDKTELAEVQDFILKCNTIAHRNPGADSTVITVADSAGLHEHLYKAWDTHSRRFARWMRENTWNTRYN